MNLSVSRCLIPAAVIACLTTGSQAQAPAFAFDTHKTRLPHADCIQDARRTAKTAGCTSTPTWISRLEGASGTRVW